MARPEFNQGKKLYFLPAYDFSSAKHGIEITFSHSANTSLCDVYVDSEEGEHICTAALSNGTGENIASCDILQTSGVHDVYLKIRGSASVTDVVFTDASPFDKGLILPSRRSALSTTVTTRGKRPICSDARFRPLKT